MRRAISGLKSDVPFQEIAAEPADQLGIDVTN